MTKQSYRKLRRRLLLSAAMLGLSGCSTGSLIGNKYGDPPPQVVFLGAVDAKGQDYLTWHRPWAFGPVPGELQAVGDINCMQVELTLRATGYHPKALDRKGNSVPGGGFFCQLRPIVGESAPPKVVLINGAPGWDRPSAFGPVPSDKLAAGNEACSKQNPKFRPLGFHPRPIDLNGAVMQQGGFLCVE
jgi:hypothetical protein